MVHRRLEPGLVGQAHRAGQRTKPGAARGSPGGPGAHRGDLPVVHAAVLAEAAPGRLEPDPGHGRRRAVLHAALQRGDGRQHDPQHPADQLHGRPGPAHQWADLARAAVRGRAGGGAVEGDQPAPDRLAQGPVALRPAGAGQPGRGDRRRTAAVQAHGAAGAQPHGNPLPDQPDGHHRVLQQRHPQAPVQAPPPLPAHQRRRGPGQHLWRWQRTGGRTPGHGAQAAAAGADRGGNHAQRPLRPERLPPQHHPRNGSPPRHQLAPGAVVRHQHSGVGALHVLAPGQERLRRPQV